jgi:hypothetical protein
VRSRSLRCIVPHAAALSKKSSPAVLPFGELSCAGESYLDNYQVGKGGKFHN